MPLGRVNKSMTPLEDREKRMPPRKRPRQQLQEEACTCDRCLRRYNLRRSGVAGDDVALLDEIEIKSESEDNDEDDLLDDEEEHALLTQEVATLKDAVAKVQSQLCVASEQLSELRALVKSLAALRHQQAPKKRRVAEP